jgi:hypothetical protein
MKLGRGEHKPVKKQDVAFSEFVLEIKSRKIKSEFLLFASLSAKKISETAYKVFGKKNQEQEIRRNGTCLIL